MDNKAIIRKIKKITKEEIEGSRQNKEYQENETKNKRNASFWEGTMFGKKILSERIIKSINDLSK